MFSNLVATLSRSRLTLPVTDLSQEDDDTYGDEYTKAVEGSYDTSYFTEPGSGKFRMPSYNKDWSGPVKIKDCTNYKEGHYGFQDKQERAKYTIDDFEYQFPFVWFQVQDFQSYLAKLPASGFDKGLKREQVIALFDEYEYFIRGDEGDYTDLSDEKYKTKAVDIGLLEIIDQSGKTPTEQWQELEPSELRDICKKNKIAATGISASMINRLIAAGVKFPYQMFAPTNLLRECHEMFVDMYIDQVQMTTDHLHPLYFKSLWEELRHVNYLVQTLDQKIKEIIKAPYWKERLCKAVRL